MHKYAYIKAKLILQFTYLTITLTHVQMEKYKIIAIMALF